MHSISKVDRESQNVTMTIVAALTDSSKTNSAMYRKKYMFQHQNGNKITSQETKVEMSNLRKNEVQVEENQKRNKTQILSCTYGAWTSVGS